MVHCSPVTRSSFAALLAATPADGPARARAAKARSRRQADPRSEADRGDLRRPVLRRPVRRVPRQLFTGGFRRLHGRARCSRRPIQGHAATETCPGHSTHSYRQPPGAHRHHRQSTGSTSGSARANKRVYCAEDPDGRQRGGCVGLHRLGPNTSSCLRWASGCAIADPASRTVSVSGKGPRRPDDGRPHRARSLLADAHRLHDAGGRHAAARRCRRPTRRSPGGWPSPSRPWRCRRCARAARAPCPPAR